MLWDSVACGQWYWIRQRITRFEVNRTFKVTNPDLILLDCSNAGMNTHLTDRKWLLERNVEGVSAFSVTLWFCAV